jgi:hypothetical protein
MRDGREAASTPENDVSEKNHGVEWQPVSRCSSVFFAAVFQNSRLMTDARNDQSTRSSTDVQVPFGSNDGESEFPLTSRMARTRSGGRT